MRSFETLEGRQFCSASAYAFDIPMQSTDSEIAVEMETSVRTTKLVTTRTQNFEIPSENLESTPVRVIESSVRTTKLGTLRKLTFDIPIQSVESESAQQDESLVKTTKLSTTPIVESETFGGPAFVTTLASNTTPSNTSTSRTQLVSNIISNTVRNSRNVSLANHARDLRQ